jgi:uncharacterized MAPEG superfamily protein
MTMPLSTEMTVLGWSFVLFLAHMMVQASTAIGDRGMAFNAGPRDDPPKPLGRMAARADRAFANFKETWPIFIALALGLAVTGRSGGPAATGAWIWLGARIAYLPLYLFGVPYVRSLAFGVSAAGLVMMALRLF